MLVSAPELVKRERDLRLWGWLGGAPGGRAPISVRAAGVPGEIRAPGAMRTARPGPPSAGLDSTAPSRRAGLAAPGTVVRGAPRPAPGHDHRPDHHHRGPDPGGDGSPLSEDQRRQHEGDRSAQPVARSDPQRIADLP